MLLDYMYECDLRELRMKIHQVTPMCMALIMGTF